VDRPRLWHALRDRAHVGIAPPALPAGDYEIVALGASVPALATAFGELAPESSFAVDDGPLQALRDLGAAVPLVEHDDLDAISRMTRDPRLA